MKIKTKHRLVFDVVVERRHTNDPRENSNLLKALFRRYKYESMISKVRVIPGSYQDVVMLTNK